MSLRERMATIISEKTIEAKILEAMTINATIRLDSGIDRSITVKQYDNLSRILKLTVQTESGEALDLNGSAIVLVIRDAINKIHKIPGVLKLPYNNIAEFIFTKECLANPGQLECEMVRIYKNGNTLSFPIFQITVKPSLYDDDILNIDEEILPEIFSPHLYTDEGAILKTNDNKCLIPNATLTSVQVSQLPYRANNEDTDVFLIESQDGSITAKVSRGDLLKEVKEKIEAMVTELSQKAESSHTHNEYATISELENKYATKTELASHIHNELHIHINKSTLDRVTPEKLAEWDAKSNFSGRYEDLMNKPAIPMVDVDKSYVDEKLSGKSNVGHTHSEYVTDETLASKNYATESYVANKIAEAQLDSDGEIDLSGLATKDELQKKADKDHTHVELHSHINKATLDKISEENIVSWNNKSNFSGNYNDLQGKPIIVEPDVNKAYVDYQLTSKAEINHSHSNYLQEADLLAKNYASQTFVETKIAEAQLNGGEVDTSLFATKEDLKGKADKSHTHSEYLVGDANSLQTVNKTVVGAINELLNKVSEGGGVVVPPSDGTVKVTDVYVTPSTLSLVVGDISTLKAIITPNNATNQRVTWSSNSNNVTVNNEGVVSAIREGNARITATTEDGGLTSHCNIQVSQPTYGEIVVSQTDVVVNERGESEFTIKLSKQPTTNQTVTISVNNSNALVSPSYLSFTPANWNVEQKVKVEGVYNPSYENKSSVITISTEGAVSKTVNIIILNEDIQEVGMQIEQSNYTITQGENLEVGITGSFDTTSRPVFKLKQEDTDLCGCYMDFSDTTKITIYTASLEAKQWDNVYISAQAWESSGYKEIFKSNNFTITIQEGSQATKGEIVVSKTELNIVGGGKDTFTVKLASQPSSNQTVNISQDNSNAVVSPSSLTFTNSNWNTAQTVTVTGSKAGVCALTISSTNVTDKKVNVYISTESSGEDSNIPVTGIIVDSWDVKLSVGQVRQMVASVTPANATNKGINWETSNPTVATVSLSGLITAKSEGYAIITARTADGGFPYNIHVNVSGDYNGEADNDYDNDIMEMPDNSVRNKVPYLSTYYIEHTIPTRTNLTLTYFVTDYYGRSYTVGSNFYKYKIIVKCDGKPDQILTNVKAGEHSINLGSFDEEGIYHYSIVARDQYGRYSHELFNYVRVKNNASQSNTYIMTVSDLNSYGITYNVGREMKQYVDVRSANGNEDSIRALVSNAYASVNVPNGKYVCLIPDRTGNGVYKGINKDWNKVQVKYASDYNKSQVAQECSRNREQLQKFLEDKVKAGYNKIVLYNATYVLDNQGIEIPSGLDLDMNGATLKTNPFTGNGALIAKMTDCTDTHVHNGTFEGDYFAHDYAGSSNNSEWVSGFEMAGSCRYCSLYDVTIKDITGYGLQNSISSTSPNGTTFFPPVLVGDKTNGFELGDIDRTTGENIPCSYRTRTKDMVDISGAIGKSDFLTVSIHLNYQGNEFSSFNMIVYFYNSSRKLIKAVNAYQYRQVKIPTGACYARTVFLGLREKSDWNVHYHFLRVPTHCKFENVTIDNARCVGMAQGQMKDFLVKGCKITNSGQSSATCAYDAEDGWDGMQDAFFENFTITECPHNGFLTCAGHNFVVNNMTADGMYMWERSRWVEIKNSTFGGVAIRGGGEKDILKHGIARFHDNTVTGLFYNLNFVSNIIKNCNLTNDKPQSGILLNTRVKGVLIDKQVVNNDINNPCVDDYGTLENIDTGNLGDDSGEAPSLPDDNIIYAGISVSTESLSLAVGETATFTVQLAKQPSHTQVITIETNGSLSISPTTLTLTPSNWNVPQSVSVRGLSATSTQITVSSPNITTKKIAVVVSNTSSGGGNTPTVTPTSATMQVEEKQTFSISGTTETIKMAYLANSKAVIYNQTSTTVTILAKGEGKDYLNIVLTDDYPFSIPLTIQQYGGVVGGGDSNYGEIQVSETSITTQVGSTKTMQVWLSSQPSQEQTVYVASGSGISVSPTSLTFSPTNWNTKQTINIQAQSQGTSQISLSANGVATKTVNVTVQGTTGGGGSNSPAITPSSATLQVGQSQTFTVSGTSATIRTVYVANGKTAVTYHDTTEVSIQALHLGQDYLNVILSDNTSFSVPIEVTDEEGGSGGITITPANPTLEVGTSTTLTLQGSGATINNCYASQGRVSISQITSNSITIYGVAQGSDTLTVALSNGSNISVNVTITQTSSGSSYGDIVASSTSLTVAQGNTVQLKVKLSKMPTSSQTVNINRSGGVAINTTSLTFTPTNWNTEQSVTITGSTTGSGQVTLSSTGVSSVTVNVTITASSSGGAGGDEGTVVDGLVQVLYPAKPKVTPKSWNALGNSITYGAGVGGNAYSYANVAAKDAGISIINNYGVSGSCINDGYNTALTEPGYDQAFVNRYNEMATGVELITVFGSVNDHRADTKLGTVGSTSSKDFYGALHVLINGLKQMYPSSRIVFITPFKIGGYEGKNLYGHTLQDFRNAIVTMCNKNQLEVLDLFVVDEFSWAKASQTGYFLPYDYYHPTAQGHQAIANYLRQNMFGGTETGGGSSGGGSTTVPVTGIQVDAWDVNLTVGQTRQMVASVVPSNATNQTINWWSQNQSVATVSQGGLITAKSEGYSLVTATTDDGGHSYNVHVNVSASSSGGSGGTINGLVTINNPATKKSKPGTWGALGDSITYGFQVGSSNAYPAKVQSATSIQATNYGISGTCISTGFNGLCSTTASQSFCNRYTSMGSHNMITVFGSVNDYLCSVPMGSSGSTDKATFYGALNVLADGLKSKYPSSRIVFFTPNRIGGHSNTNQQGLTLKDYRNAIVTVCNNKGIEVLDLYSLDSMDADINVSNYMGTWDTTHPNGNGQQVIADFIVSNMFT